MRNLMIFESISANGYFAGPNGELDWAHAHGDDKEFQDFVKGNASGDGVLLFGRVTYDMMIQYWPTPMAMQNDPVVAKGMNAAEKYVFSKSMTSASWSNTTLVKTDPAEFVQKLKQKSGGDLVVLGSGSIVRQLADANLIDRYQLVVKSIALPAGRTIFDGLKQPVNLALAESRALGKNHMVLTYEPVA